MDTTVKPDPDLPDPGRLERLRAKGGELVRRELRAIRRAGERAAMAQAAAAAVPEPITKGGFVTNARTARGDVFKAEHADPDRPLRDQDGVQTGFHSIKGMRAAQGGHDYLLRRGSIDADQHRAADRYAASWAGTVRSGSALGGIGNVRLPVHQQGCPTSAMVACAADIRMAAAALGQGARILVHQVAVQGITLAAISEASGEKGEIALGRLRAALDRLCELWPEDA